VSFFPLFVSDGNTGCYEQSPYSSVPPSPSCLPMLYKRSSCLSEGTSFPRPLPAGGEFRSFSLIQSGTASKSYVHRPRHLDSLFYPLLRCAYGFKRTTSFPSVKEKEDLANRISPFLFWEGSWCRRVCIPCVFPFHGPGFFFKKHHLNPPFFSLSQSREDIKGPFGPSYPNRSTTG